MEFGLLMCNFVLEWVCGGGVRRLGVGGGLRGLWWWGGRGHEVGGVAPSLPFWGWGGVRWGWVRQGGTEGS